MAMPSMDMKPMLAKGSPSSPKIAWTLNLKFRIGSGRAVVAMSSSSDGRVDFGRERPSVELGDADDDELGGILQRHADLHADLAGLDHVRRVQRLVAADVVALG